MLKFSVERQKVKGEIENLSAAQTITLKDLSSHLGIKAKRRYISDEISSWNLMITFQNVHCVDEVQSFDENTKTHSWNWSTPCEGLLCENAVVSVTNRIRDRGLPANCGDGVQIFISQSDLDNKVLDFDFLGISEIVVIGRQLDTIQNSDFEFS